MTSPSRDNGPCWSGTRVPSILKSPRLWGEALAGYDRAYWRQYDADAAAGTYQTGAYLYAEAPDVAACFAGRLTQGSRNRALEAANQIRALHGLPPVRWNSLYSRQVQEAALVQAANDFLSHQPGPRARLLQRSGGGRQCNQ